MQPEDILEGLGLAAVQVRCVIINAEQRRRVEPIPPKRRAGGGVVADLYGIGDIERPHILEIFDGERGEGSVQVNEKNSFAGAATAARA